jgi:pimeloyl-ACP methyl ester carboxylesterase
LTTNPELLELNRDGTVLSAHRRPGKGVPVVIVPGVMADAATWRPVIDSIDLPNPVVTVNRRGRVPSGSLGADYSVRVEVDDLRHVIDSLGGTVHLFGWSYGALITLETALDHDGILSLTAYEPVARPFGQEAVTRLRDAIAAHDLDRAVELVNTVVSGFSTDYVAELRRSPVWPVLLPLAQPLAEELAAINDYEAALSRYRGIAAPTMLILGELNEGRPPYGSAFTPFAAALPQARLVRLPGQGHLAHASAPQDLGRVIADAVKRVGV